MKKNRAELRKVMAEYDITAEVVAHILKKTTGTIHHYASKSPRLDISDANLYYLKGMLSKQNEQEV